MSVSATAPGKPSGGMPGTIHGKLARIFQEVLTVIVRVKNDRQQGRDGGTFRTHVKSLLARADEEARKAGYDRETVRMSVYAVVAFLDEAVLNSSQPMFADWPRQPLQEEVFGDHMAGETFFQNLSELLNRQDSEELADLLEVYQLCLILGYRGRFGAGGEGEIHRFTSTIQDRLERIRKGHPPLAPRAGLPDEETVPKARDRWVRRLVILLLVLVVVGAGLYLGYRLMLGGAMNELAGLASGSSQ